MEVAHGKGERMTGMHLVIESLAKEDGICTCPIAIYGYIPNHLDRVYQTVMRIYTKFYDPQ